MGPIQERNIDWLIYFKIEHEGHIEQVMANLFDFAWPFRKHYVGRLGAERASQVHKLERDLINLRILFGLLRRTHF